MPPCRTLVLAAKAFFAMGVMQKFLSIIKTVSSRRYNLNKIRHSPKKHLNEGASAEFGASNETTSAWKSSPKHIFLWGALALLVAILLRGLGPVLSPFLLSIILAYTLQPGVNWLSNHKVPRGIAALLMMLMLIFAVIFIVLFIMLATQREGPQIQEQMTQLLARWEQAYAPRLARFGITPDFNLLNFKDFAMKHLAGNTDTLLSAAWSSVRTGGNVMISVIGNVVMVPLVLYYLLCDWHKLLKRTRSLIPRRWVKKAVALSSEVDQMLSQYLRGQLLVMLILAAYYSICLSLARFEMALPVGMFTGLAVVIPYVGYYIGLTLALGIALLQFGNWWAISAVIIIYAIGQVLESSVLTPRLVGERIGLHPLAVIFALLAFGQLFGFFGILIALPVSAILVIVLRELCRKYLASSLYKH